jgi:glycosyltransferase involved in cell wall biosynthesis
MPIPPASPSVSVVIPIYNGEADLPELLNCLRSQTYPAAEYLLVDNGSTDRTLALLQAQDWLTALSETAIQSSYAARNTGIRIAQAPIVAFTDADCRPQPDWLAQLVQPFADETIGMVAGEILALPGDSLLERYADRHATLSQKQPCPMRSAPTDKPQTWQSGGKPLSGLAYFAPI